MGFPTAMKNALAKLLFNGTPIAGIADNAAAAPAATYYLSLHIADPGDAGTQATSEASYPGYARQPVARTAAGFNVTGGDAALVSNADFPEGTAAGNGNVTFWGIGLSLNGAGTLIAKGPTNKPIPTGDGITPRLKVGSKVSIINSPTE